MRIGLRWALAGVVGVLAAALVVGCGFVGLNTVPDARVTSVAPALGAEATSANPPPSTPMPTRVPTVVAGPTLQQRLDRAASTATSVGYTAGIAVFDTATGAVTTGGQADRRFGTASVVKVMIAAYLLDTGRMTGETQTMAYDMITRSNDSAADVLWGVAGGEQLEPWIAQHYHISDLGSPNQIEWRWGNTHVTALGLARLYAALKNDRRVWPWLSSAMHGWQPTAADGTDQRFGLAAVQPAAAVKQGWSAASADDPDDAIVNTTGFVDHDRYVVVVLTEGHDNVDDCDDQGFDADQARVVTAMARAVLDGLG